MHYFSDAPSVNLRSPGLAAEAQRKQYSKPRCSKHSKCCGKDGLSILKLCLSSPAF